MIRCYIRLDRVGRLLLLLVVGWVGLMASSSQAQVTLNVTNFGARGDAVQFSANTASNSVIVTTTDQVSSADVGKVVVLFGVGPLGTVDPNGLYHHQDLLTTIAGVDGTGTNITLAKNCYATTNAQGYYGHNNCTNFQNCINAARSNSVINIPVGTYLIIGASNFVPNLYMPSKFTAYPSLILNKGGITFQGENETNTILLGCGAWQNETNGANIYAYRGYLLEFENPMSNGVAISVTNNGPVIFDNLTIDGGVQRGMDTSSYTYWPATTYDGSGWDNSHKCFVDVKWPGKAFFNSRILHNCHILRWRGEMMYSQIPWDAPSNMLAWAFTNCVFSDGMATALNLSSGNTADHCVFSNLYEVCEFYAAYATNSSVMQFCLITNMFGALGAWNGATTNGRNPPYLIQSNVFYMPASGGNGLQTCAAQNFYVLNNSFFGAGSGTAINLGVAGQQPTDGTQTYNSNVVVSGNLFSNVYDVISVQGAGLNRVHGILVSSNVVWSHNFAVGYGWSTNVVFAGNTAIGVGGSGTLDSSQLQGQWFNDDPSDRLPPLSQADTVGRTNTISYAMGGMRHQIWVNANNSVWVIDDTQPAKIPPSATLQITNTWNYAVSVYSSATMSGAPFVLTPGQMVTYWWAHTMWATNVPSAVTGLHIKQ